MNLLSNKVQLIGNLGADPEVKELENGNKVAKFFMATKEFHKDKEGNSTSDTCWHSLVAWGDKAKYVEKYLKKGIQIAVEGRLTNRTYEGKDGVKKYFTEIVVRDLVMFSSHK